MSKIVTAAILVIIFLTSARWAGALDTITVALTAKAFQYTILPVALERGYMKEESIDLKFTYMQVSLTGFEPGFDR